MLTLFATNDIFQKSNIESVACGASCTAVVTDDGKLYAWGSGLPALSNKIPSFISVPKPVKQVACGHTHAALISTDGMLFTWGSGEHGALGHGTKTNVPSPKLVASMNTPHFTTVSVSCGAFHTAAVAGKTQELTYLNIPRRKPSTIAQRFPIGDHDEDPPGSDSRDFFVCGQLYCCGQGKAGQLGLSEDMKRLVPRFQLVDFFENHGLSVAAVSCGFHHTLVITTPKAAFRVFSTALYSFGWGEYGRLGLGDEEQRMTPSLVQFPGQPFHPLSVSAGEQHSLAANGDVAFAWGNNSMGQLGVGSPSTTEMALTPQRIPLPEGMTLRALVAGGRHSAALTECNKILTWGWAEEGQTGLGTERNSYLARPCRLPFIASPLLKQPQVVTRQGNVVPKQIALGMAHTVAVLRNQDHLHEDVELPKPPPTPPPPEREPTPPPTPAAVVPSPPRTRTPSPPRQPSPVAKTMVLVMEEDDDNKEEEDPMPPKEEEEPPAPLVPVCSLRDLLQRREERAALRYVARSAPPSRVTGEGMDA